MSLLIYALSTDDCNTLYRLLKRKWSTSDSAVKLWYGVFGGGAKKPMAQRTNPSNFGASSGLFFSRRKEKEKKIFFFFKSIRTAKTCRVRPIDEFSEVLWRDESSRQTISKIKRCTVKFSFRRARASSIFSWPKFDKTNFPRENERTFLFSSIEDFRGQRRLDRRQRR